MNLDISKRIGLVGCGRWGKNILRDLKTLECYVAVVARSNHSVNNAQQYGADHIFHTVQGLLDDQIDGYIVATPTNTHAEVIEPLVLQQRPIFTEKPLSNSVDAAQALLDKAGDYIFVMDKWKYHHGIIKLSQLIDTGKYGQVQQIVLRRNQWRSPHTDVDPIWILIPHDISIVQLLLGETPKPLFALSNRLRSDYLSSLHAVLEAGDVKIVIEVSADSALTERCVSVVCEHASLVLSNSYSDHILVMEDDVHGFKDEPQKIPFEPNMPLFDELKRFIDYLSDPTVDLQSSSIQGFETVKLISELRRMAIH